MIDRNCIFRPSRSPVPTHRDHFGGVIGAQRAELASQLLLALAVAEVCPADSYRRRVVLNEARTRILRNAQRRDNPQAFCLEVRLNRRLLELSGGVPADLPGSPG